MIRVYVVEDNEFLLEDIVHSLKFQGYDCYGVENAQAFYSLLAQQAPDIVILDWNLPDENGLSIARRLQESNITQAIGIIFLTVRGQLEDRLAGLEYADTYLTKPVDYKELGAIITSTYRRLAPPNISPSWALYPQNLELHTPQDSVISLSYREYLTLYKLSTSENSIILAKDIVEALGEDWLKFEKNRLELLISRLRRKFKDYSEIDFNPIRSIRNEGYQLTLTIKIRTQKPDFYKKPQILSEHTVRSR